MLTINETYKNLSIHEKINCRTNTMIDLRTGLTPYTHKSRFRFNLIVNHNNIEFYDQPILFRKDMLNDKEFILDYDIKY